ncbi:hypothetical protein ACVWZM_005570 [Bradyrhizobium sp. USDA 4501]|nr:hypothetical protein [Bradyrhizobium elkanii]
MARSMRCVWALSVQFEPAANARDHEVESLQHVVGIVERPVGKNVGLDSFEDPEILAESLVQPVGFPVLLRDLLDRKTASIVAARGIEHQPNASSGGRRPSPRSDNSCGLPSWNLKRWLGKGRDAVLCSALC